MDFEKIKIKIKKLVEEELFSLEPWIINVGWEEKLPKLNELREKVKDMGLWLPQIPKEYGGLGLSLQQHGEVSEDEGQWGDMMPCDVMPCDVMPPIAAVICRNAYEMKKEGPMPPPINLQHSLD